MTMRKMRWYRRFFDKPYRLAQKRAAAIKRGEVAMQTVDYTDGGLSIVMPADISDQWELMPPDVRRRFMADLDAMKASGGIKSGDGYDHRIVIAEVDSFDE